jgi:hypothetical protein
MNIKQRTRAIRIFVSKHRVAIAVTVTSIAWITLMARNAAAWNEFLKEHNLFDEFYAMNEIE